MHNIKHIPVLLDEVIHYLTPKDGEIYIDGTFGAGGYTKAILNAADCSVYAIDCDPGVRPTAQLFDQEYKDRFKFLHGRFSQMAELLEQEGIAGVNGVVLDIGVSSMQLDEANRGFSFMRDGPLDMRMSSQGGDAAGFINNAEEKVLADVIYRYGGEKKSRYIAKAIVEARTKKPIVTTLEFAQIVRGAIHGKREKIDQATRTFQAIRIWVNDELGELQRALHAATKVLIPGGRMVVVSFHSLEDSIVKSFIYEKSGKTDGISRHILVSEVARPNPVYELLARKAVVPSEDEITKNPRARSAKLRAVRKMV